MYEKKLNQNIPIELTDDQLEQAAGGAKDGDLEAKRCQVCCKDVNHICRDGHWYCTVCGSKYKKPLITIFIKT